MSQPDPAPIPEWLDKLQNESWEAEILISGGAFVGLISALSFFETLVNTLYFTSTLTEGVVATSGAILVFTWTLLVGGFFIHLILRGFWIGLIGLNFAFPKGIDNERLGFKGRFIKLNKEPSNTPLILRLDKICGTLFAFTFMAFFSLVGIALYMMMMGGLFMLAEAFVEKGILGKLVGVLFFFLIFLGILTLIDYLTFGWLKRIRWFAKVYYPFHYFISIVTLSIVYRRLYYTLISNFKWRYIALFVVVQGILLTAIVSWSGNPSGISDSLISYNASNKESDYELLIIKDDVISGNYLELIVLHSVRIEESMLKSWKEDHKEEKAATFEDLSAAAQRALFDKTYQVAIDSLPATSIRWTFHKTRMGDSYISPGVVQLQGRVDTRDLAPGPHDIKIVLGVKFESLKQGDLGYVAKTSFWIEK